MTQLLLGKNPARPGAVKIKFGDVVNTSTLAAPPAEFGHDKLVGSWPMLANDRVGDCISPDTRVLTASLEWVAAGGLRVGDKLLGFDEESQPDSFGRRRGRRFTECSVEKATIVKRPCYQLEFADGTKVVSSSGHRWLVSSTVQGSLGSQQWERTEDLRVGPTRQTKVIKPLEVWDTDTSWDAGYLAGAFDGEGNLENYQSTGRSESTHTRVNFSQTDNAMLYQVQRSLKELGFEPTNYLQQRHSQKRVDGTARKDITRISIGTRAQFLKFMGSVRPLRLLEKMDGDYGVIPGDAVELVSKTFIGDHDVVMLDTSSRTYFANGLASHNCAIADALHGHQLWNAENGIAIPLNDQAAVNNYVAVTGYDGTPATDNGTDVAELIKYRYQHGLQDAAGRVHKIGAAVALEPGNWEQLITAMYYFDGVTIGVDMSQQWMDAFNKGGSPVVWDAVKTPRKLGGHAITGVAFHNNLARIVTWGTDTVGITEKGYAQANDETYAYFSTERLKNGIDINGIDGDKLQADLTLLLDVA